MKFNENHPCFKSIVSKANCEGEVQTAYLAEALISDHPVGKIFFEVTGSKDRRAAQNRLQEWFDSGYDISEEPNPHWALYHVFDAAISGDPNDFINYVNDLGDLLSQEQRDILFEQARVNSVFRNMAEARSSLRFLLGGSGSVGGVELYVQSARRAREILDESNIDVPAAVDEFLQAADDLLLAAYDRVIERPRDTLASLVESYADRRAHLLQSMGRTAEYTPDVKQLQPYDFDPHWPLVFSRTILD